MCLKKFAPTLRAEMDDPNKKADFDLAMDQAWDLIREQILYTNQGAPVGQRRSIRSLQRVSCMMISSHQVV